jgi:chromosome partitioning protein
MASREKLVRKLLVASQQGGVGKTTTAVNLAAAAALAGQRVLLLDADPLSSISASLRLGEHPNRQLLPASGADLPGLLVCNVLPRLDVLCPYEGGCTDADLGRLLRVVGTPAVASQFGCLVVNTPPFLGANPGPLLAACEEFIVLMRAEPMAYRTLPAFLELVQRSRGAGPAIKMRGILLSLPEGEAPGGNGERELRGRLGGRILPEVIPHDPEVERAQAACKLVSASNRESPAAVQYHQLVESLGLAMADFSLGNADTQGVLVQAAAAIPAETPLARPDSQAAPSAAATIPKRPRRGGSTAVAIPPALRHRVPTPAVARQAPANIPPAADEEKSLPPVAPSKATPALKPLVAVPVDGGKFVQQWALLWVGLAILVGVALRFLRVPDWVLPLLAGVAAAAVSVVVLRQFALREEPSPAPGATEGPDAGKQPSRRPARAESYGKVVRRNPSRSGSEN